MMLWEIGKKRPSSLHIFQGGFQSPFGSKVLSDFSKTAPIMIQREFRKFIGFFPEQSGIFSR